MTRDLYLKLRNANDLGAICYSYYVKVAKELNLQIYNIKYFINALNAWIFENPGVKPIEWSTAYYDSKFNIVTLSLNGKVISYS